MSAAKSPTFDVAAIAKIALAMPEEFSTLSATLPEAVQVAVKSAIDEAQAAQSVELLGKYFSSDTDPNVLGNVLELMTVLRDTVSEHGHNSAEGDATRKNGTRSSRVVYLHTAGTDVKFQVTYPETA